MIQPHYDALVITINVADFNVKRVTIDQGNGAKIMNLDLYHGMGLTPMI